MLEYNNTKFCKFQYLFSGILKKVYEKFIMPSFSGIFAVIQAPCAHFHATKRDPAQKAVDLFSEIM